ncbi:hypothetical protein BWI93_00975 [Siphonobacter sp. BAB-5385]|uniref:hypothetical protein n=1 Tax=Siphonobacter sp. BAB-5385 TaxID=1864822 RepID=UPI000B9EC3B7|nr:hypothetical protein [Siphonobacter sp. BAB-5385]OZI09943.1 hypothetical protein BWI93_00975 [Siphonobacter sp. BAB-5385]
MLAYSELTEPPSFDPRNPDNFIIDLEKSFARTCAALEESGCKEPKELSIFEFYARIQQFEQRKPHAKSE